MIIDKFENILIYENMVKNLREAVNVLKSIDKFEVGRYEYDWGFFMVQEGVTKGLNEGKFETHEKYVDVQILLEGSEVLAWADSKELFEAEPYNDVKDATYYQKGSVENRMKITPNMFYICFAHDGHKAVRHIDFPTRYKKIVLKLPR